MTWRGREHRKRNEYAYKLNRSSQCFPLRYCRNLVTVEGRKQFQLQNCPPSDAMEPRTKTLCQLHLLIEAVITEHIVLPQRQVWSKQTLDSLQPGRGLTSHWRPRPKHARKSQTTFLRSCEMPVGLCQRFWCPQRTACARIFGAASRLSGPRCQAKLEIEKETWPQARRVGLSAEQVRLRPHCSSSRRVGLENGSRRADSSFSLRATAAQLNNAV